MASKETNMTQEEKYIADSVIGRGYDIYNEWKNEKISSRIISSRIKRTLAGTKEKKAEDKCNDAFSGAY